jgi:ABC-2 type transport system permease protein
MSRIGLQIFTLWQREVVRFFRQRSRMLGALLQPLVFWLFLGAGMNASFRPPGMGAGMSYVEYFYPGVIILLLLFTAIFAPSSTVQDRREGFLQGVLVAPVSRLTVVIGQSLGGTTLAVGQAIVFLILSPFAGIHLTLWALVSSIFVMILISFALTNLGLAVAWRIESTQGFHVIMNSILIPIWLLSGAFFPSTGAPSWLRWTMTLNPLTYAMAALRETLYMATPEVTGGLPGLGLSLAVTAVFCLVTLCLVNHVANRTSTI